VSFDIQLRSALQSIHGKPSPSEATAIIDVARLAAAADKRTDISETVVLLALTKIVCEMAGMKEAPETTVVDGKRLAEIGEQLAQNSARELAYACAFLVMVQDLDLTKEESQMANALGEALVIEPARAKQLATSMETLVRAARS
jgi:hypothetical protein